jgi:outer membrane receptor for ferrienterochelin and colicin
LVWNFSSTKTWPVFLVGNHGRFANIDYTGGFDWGTLEAKFYWQDTRHKMGFFTSEKPGMMPMRTHGEDIGYTLKAEIPLAQRHTLHLGNEYHRTRLDDYWPAFPGNMMMGPNTYVNINDGQRDRLAFFAEAESRWTSKWATLIGLRDEIVQTDAGAVQPDLAHVGDIKEAGPSASMVVFMPYAPGILQRHGIAGERHHPAAPGKMQIV